MKKIIFLLALLSLGVSKAQVVGGYLPLNSTKTATMGGLRVNGNETVTGTFSVGSTATITGVLNTNSVSNSATGYVRGGYLQANGTNGLVIGGLISGVNRIDNNSGTFRFLSSSDVASPISVSTMSLGSANLTGGNTGTVAVLSDAVFPVTFNSSAGTNLADATTYYFGNTGWSYNTNSGQGIVTLPYNCTLVSWNYDNLVLGTLGSSEACTVQVSGTTTLNLSSVVTLSAATSNYTGTVNTNFTAGDQINIKFIAPTWATNPTTLISSMVLWFVRRS